MSCHLCEPRPRSNKVRFQGADFDDTPVKEILEWEKRRDSKLLLSKDARAQNNTLLAKTLFLKDELFAKPPKVELRTAAPALFFAKQNGMGPVTRGYIMFGSLLHYMQHFPNDDEAFFQASLCLELLDKEIRSLLQPFLDSKESHV